MTPWLQPLYLVSTLSPERIPDLTLVHRLSVAQRAAEAGADKTATGPPTPENVPPLYGIVWSAVAWIS